MLGSLRLPLLKRGKAKQPRDDRPSWTRHFHVHFGSMVHCLNVVSFEGGFGMQEDHATLLAELEILEEVHSMLTEMFVERADNCSRGLLRVELMYSKF